MIHKLRERAASVVQRVSRAAREPREELARWRSSLRFAYELSQVGVRRLRQDRAPEMAAALAFRTLFALAPVLVVATILVRAIAGLDEFLRIIGGLLDAAGLGDVRIVLPAAGDASEALRSESLKDWLARLVAQTTQISLPAVGWLGFAMILYAAISLLRTIECSFNVIYRAPQSRPRSRSIPLYWFLLTVSPLAITLASYLNGQVTSLGATLAWNDWTTAWTAFAWSGTITWALITATFVLVPNAPVAIRPAAAGALVTVVLLEVGKRTIGSYLASSFAITQLVTSLGLIPLFMFWVYLMWLAVLVGLESSALLQHLDRRELAALERTPESIEVTDATIVVTAMQTLAREFTAGRPMSAANVASELRLSQRTCDAILRTLLDAGLLHRLEGAEPRFCLAQPPSDIQVERLLEIGYEIVDANRPNVASALVRELREAQLATSARWSLARLIAD